MVLRLPQGLEAVGIEWFDTDDIEKVIIPSSVRVLREHAFILCEFLSIIRMNGAFKCFQTHFCALFPLHICQNTLVYDTLSNKL